MILPPIYYPPPKPPIIIIVNTHDKALRGCPGSGKTCDRRTQMLEHKIETIDIYILLYAASNLLSEKLECSFQEAKDSIIEEALIFQEMQIKADYEAETLYEYQS